MLIISKTVRDGVTSHKFRTLGAIDPGYNAMKNF